MSDIREFNHERFKKLTVKSFMVNGKKTNNTIKCDEIGKNKDITIDIIIEENTLKNKSIYRNKEVDYYENQ